MSLILPRPYGDNLTMSIVHLAHNVVSIPVPRQLEVTRKLLAEQAIDVLVVLDHSIDPFLYTLLHSRLAPVQVRRYCPLAVYY